MCDPVANYMAPYPINNRQQYPATNRQPLQSLEQEIRPPATKQPAVRSQPAYCTAVYRE